MKPPISQRFRGFLPIVIDLETGGFDAQKNALLELAAVVINMDDQGQLYKEHVFHYHIKPFEGAKIDPESLKVNGIQPYHPLRIAKDEKEVLADLFNKIRQQLNSKHCSKAIMVAHNALFDMGFLNAAIVRNKLDGSPFHSFSTFDTVTLGGLACGQTVLSRVAEACGLPYDTKQAHGAKYDAELTADIFCQIINRFPFEKD